MVGNWPSKRGLSFDAGENLDFVMWVIIQLLSQKNLAESARSREY